MEEPNFWDDAEKASASMKEVKDLKSVVERADGLSQEYEDILTLIEMGNEEEDASLIPEVEQEYKDFVEEFEDLRITTMRFLPFMPEPAEQKVATGLVCSVVCMSGGRTAVDSM